MGRIFLYVVEKEYITDSVFRRKMRKHTSILKYTNAKEEKKCI